jgi:hypothetical protein
MPLLYNKLCFLCAKLVHIGMCALQPYVHTFGRTLHAHMPVLRLYSIRLEKDYTSTVLCTGPRLLMTHTHTNGNYWIQDNQQATTKTDVCDAETSRFYFVNPLPQNPFARDCPQATWWCIMWQAKEYVGGEGPSTCRTTEWDAVSVRPPKLQANHIHEVLLHCCVVKLLSLHM